MLRDFSIAFRNVTRQRRRSAIGLAAVAFGVIALLEAGGFNQWALWAMREGTIHSRYGHLQIVRQDFYRSGFADPFDYLLPAQSAHFDEIQKLPGVAVITPRLAFNGLVSIGESTVAFSGEGMDPANEEQLNSATLMLEGQPLSASDPTGIIIGQGLAASLGVKVGERIALLANTRNGINGAEGIVRGVFATATKAYDDATLRVPLALARKLLRVSGSHVWAILLDDTALTGATVAALAPRLAAHGMQVVPWYELADFYVRTEQLFARQLTVVKLIIAVIVVLCVLNTLTMTVLERTGEIGTSMALGWRRRNILQQFIGEGIAIGAIGCVAGIAIGIVLARLISGIGIPLPPPPGVTRELIAEIRITRGLIGEATALVFAAAIAAAIYPAVKAARMAIVDALRFNR